MLNRNVKFIIEEERSQKTFTLTTQILIIILLYRTLCRAIRNREWLLGSTGLPLSLAEGGADGTQSDGDGADVHAVLAVAAGLEVAVHHRHRRPLAGPRLFRRERPPQNTEHGWSRCRTWWRREQRTAEVIRTRTGAVAIKARTSRRPATSQTG